LVYFTATHSVGDALSKYDGELCGRGNTTAIQFVSHKLQEVH